MINDVNLFGPRTDVLIKLSERFLRGNVSLPHYENERICTLSLSLM